MIPAVYSHSLSRKVPHIFRSKFWLPRVHLCWLSLPRSFRNGLVHNFVLLHLNWGRNIAHGWYNHCVAVCQPGEQQHCSSWLSQWFYEMDMNNENSSPTHGGPCRKSMPHDGGTQSFVYITYALPRVFRDAPGKQRFRETFRGASATAVPASAKVLELTSLTKLFLGGFDRCAIVIVGFCF